MDVELLIAKVYARQSVWDKWNKHYANRNVVDKLWAEISQELNMKMMIFSKLFSLLSLLTCVWTLSSSMKSPSDDDHDILYPDDKYSTHQAGRNWLPASSVNTLLHWFPVQVGTKNQHAGNLLSLCTNPKVFIPIKPIHYLFNSGQECRIIMESEALSKPVYSGHIGRCCMGQKSFTSIVVNKSNGISNRISQEHIFLLTTHIYFRSYKYLSIYMEIAFLKRGRKTKIT